MKINFKHYFAYYHKKKYKIGEVDLKFNQHGFRIEYFNVISCLVDNKLDKRKKQLVIHRLITGRGLRKKTFKTKECNHNE